MRRSLGPLLCELHAHSSWSDGDLTVSELVELHGRSGFDVLCVTDHVVRRDDPWRESEGIRFRSVDEDSWEPYVADVEQEAQRAWRTYGMLVVPGLELTFNDVEPVLATHVLAIGLRSFVSVDHGIAKAIETAAEAGAAIIAAHPYNGEPAPSSTRLTKRFARDETLRGLVHRFELFNRTQLYGWWRRRAFLPSQLGTFIVPSTSQAGRRSSRAFAMSRPSSTTCAHRALSTSLDSTSRSRALRPEGAVAFVG